MVTWKDYYVELERRRNQIAEAEQYRLVKLCSSMRETHVSNTQVRIPPMQFVYVKETK